MEREFDVKPIGIKYICDVCSKGEMLPNGKNDFRHSVEIGHTCSYCGEEQKFVVKYPLTRYKFS